MESDIDVFCGTNFEKFSKDANKRCNWIVLSPFAAWLVLGYKSQEISASAK